jgi:hypothetical protein
MNIVKQFLLLVAQDSHYVSVIRGKHTLSTINGELDALVSATDILGNVSAVIQRENCQQVIQVFKSELLVPSGINNPAEGTKGG